MLDPDYLEQAGELVASVYVQIEAEMLDYLAGRMIAGDVANQRSLTALNNLVQSDQGALRGILDSHKDEIADAVREEVSDALRRSDADDLRRIKEGMGVELPAITTRQVATTVAGVERILARQNLKMPDDAKRAFLEQSAWAVTQVNTGAMTTERALHAAVRRLEREGVSTVTYRNAETGAQTVRNKVDVAVRRHIRTQIAQDSMRRTEQVLDDAGVELVEVSSHAGSRPSHQEWEGRVYSRSGDKVIGGVRYRDFRTACCWGDVADGIGGANCRHSYAAYFPGMERAYRPNPKHPSGMSNTQAYELTQRQRALERGIRATKRELRGAQMLYGADPSLENLGAVEGLKRKLRARQAKVRELVAANPKVLQRSPRREWAGDMPKGVTIRKQKDLDSYLGSAAVVAKREAKGVSRSALEKAVRRELSGMDVKAGHFDLLSVRERDGIMSRAWAAIDSRLPSTKKASAGMHAIKQYVACKTKKDALKFARDELGFEAVSEALTLSELNEVNAAFYELMQRNPFMKGYVRDIKTGKMGACAHFAVRRIEIGPGKFSFKTEFKFDRNSLTNAVNECNTNCKPSPQLGGNVGWTLKHDASGIVAHEFAHAIEYKVTMKRLGFDPGDELDILQVAEFHNARGSVSKEIIEKAFERAGIEYNDANVMKHVSVYGAKNTRETLAEALSCEDDSNIVCNEIKRATQELLRSEGLI